MHDMLSSGHLVNTLSDAAAALTLRLLQLPRVTLRDAQIDPLPMVYALWIDDATYFHGTWPFYVGSADDGRRRLTEHRRTYRDAVGIRADSVQISWLDAADFSVALWAEQVLLQSFVPVANTVLKGSGCKRRGRLRANGTETPFRLMYPHSCDVVDVEAQRRIRRRVVEHLAATAPPVWVMESLGE